MRKRARREAATIIKFTNAQSCLHSQKQIRNNSVYCTRLDQWLAINYCQNVCQDYEPQEVTPSTIPQEYTIDKSGSIRNEKGEAVTDPDHIIDQTDDGDQTEW